MRPLIIELPGEYWDAQIYSGRLFTFGFDQSILATNWDSLVREASVLTQDPQLFIWAFARNDHLYRTRNWMRRAVDSDLGQAVYSGFQVLHESLPEIHQSLFSEAREFQMENPVPFPHADSHVYNYDLFVGGRSGLWCLRGFPSRTESDQVLPEKLWDAPVTHLATRLGMLAMAAGDEGLWEASAGDAEETRWMTAAEPTQIASVHCTHCAYMYYSVFGSSHSNGGFLARFEVDEPVADLRTRRALQEVQPADELFGASSYAWGIWNRLCSLDAGDLVVKSYYETAGVSAPRMNAVRSLSILDDEIDVPVKAEIAPFGVVIESDSDLVIVTNNRQTVALPGEPVRWRVLPRSKFYFDLLLVLYEDRLSVVSFVEDSLMNRSRYTLGTSVPRDRDADN